MSEDIIEVSSAAEESVEKINMKQKPEVKASIFNFNTPFANLIGKGDQAKDSVVWYLITRLVRMSFLIILILFVVDICKNDGKNCVSLLKDVWSVFAPIITLAMGYLFGKKERSAGD